MSWLNLANRCAIVTGSASGIGKAVAFELERAGCSLVLADLNPELNPLVGDSNNPSSSSSDHRVAFQCNVADRAQVDALMQHSREATILVNCAGITSDAFMDNLTESDWDRVVDVNLKGTFHTCQSFLRHSTGIQHHGGGAIVNLGSVVSEQGNLGQVNYAASKGGVLGLTRALARETARRGVRVNAVVPGFIETPMSEAVPDAVLQSIRQKIALQTFGQPEDVANLIAFLVSDRSKYITGEAIECSGMISL